MRVRHSRTVFLTGTNTLTQNTNGYSFQYNQGFSPGTTFQVQFQNSRTTTNNQRSNYSPELSTLFQAKITQHLLNGFGTGINKRFIAQAINNRRITDSAFRQQLLYTINQVENIYWALVSAYENVQSAQRALWISRRRWLRTIASSCRSERWRRSMF